MKIDFDFANTIKGFIEDSEALRLYETAFEAAQLGPCLEVGSFCGKSAYFIGTACKEWNSVLFSVDHHRGSEEHQAGEEYFDPDLVESDICYAAFSDENPLNCNSREPYDYKSIRINTFNIFRHTIESAGLDEIVVPIVARSAVAGKMWKTPLAMVFIDGGHSFEAAETDYRTWGPHIMNNGFLVIHDIFLDEAKGGQAPRRIYEMAVDSGLYKDLGITNTLGVLKKIDKSVSEVIIV